MSSRCQLTHTMFHCNLQDCMAQLFHIIVILLNSKGNSPLHITLDSRAVVLLCSRCKDILGGSLPLIHEEIGIFHHQNEICFSISGFDIIEKEIISLIPKVKICWVGDIVKGSDTSGTSITSTAARLCHLHKAVRSVPFSKVAHTHQLGAVSYSSMEMYMDITYHLGILSEHTQEMPKSRTYRLWRNTVHLKSVSSDGDHLPGDRNNRVRKSESIWDKSGLTS